jgi:peptidyl-prolyl cis-trans isomerase D
LISTMREYFRSLKIILLFVVVAFIGTSVLYFGASSFSGDTAPDGSVATVNGEHISRERFRRAYGNYMEFYRQLYKERLTPELAERLGLSQQVVDALVQEALIVQQAQREGLRVSDEEVRARIQSIPSFQVDGRFSRDRYISVLRQVRMEPAEFETEQRRELQRRKAENTVREGIKVSEDEVRQAYTFRRETVRVAWARLDIDPLLAQVAVADGEVEPYLKANEAKFSRPERRRIQYVVISGKAFATPISDADAEAYYKEHPKEFEKPRRLRASHVLVRVPPVGGSDAEQKSRAKVADVIKRAKAGEDFAKLAKEISEDTASAAQGGDLGFVAKGEMVPQFEEAVFALGKGEVTANPVRTPFGYHAIKVVDVEEGGRPAFKEVSAQIKEKLLAERTERAVQQKAEEVRVPLQAAKDFPGEAKKLGLEPLSTTMARGDGIESIGRDTQLEEAVFAVVTGGVTVPVKTAGGHVIAQVVQVTPAGVPPLAEVREPVVEAIKKEKAEALAKERGKALAEALGKGGDFAAVARSQGWSVGETDAFSRAEPPKGRDALPGQVVVAALQTATGQVSAPVQGPTGIYLVKGIERKGPDASGFEAERDDLRKQVLEQKRSLVLESWLRGLRAQAKVTVEAQRGAAAR